eukprot:653563-Rhodomonas_salina.2
MSGTGIPRGAISLRAYYAMTDTDEVYAASSTQSWPRSTTSLWALWASLYRGTTPCSWPPGTAIQKEEEKNKSPRRYQKLILPQYTYTPPPCAHTHTHTHTHVTNNKHSQPSANTCEPRYGIAGERMHRELNDKNPHSWSELNWDCDATPGTHCTGVWIPLLVQTLNCAAIVNLVSDFGVQEGSSRAGSRVCHRAQTLRALALHWYYNSAIAYAPATGSPVLT